MYSSYHVSGQDNLASLSGFQNVLQIRVGERSRVVLRNDRLPFNGLQLGELFSKLSSRSEDGSSSRSSVDDVDNRGLGGTVLLKKRGEGNARSVYVGDAKLSLSILVLSVDDDEDAVAGRGSGGLDADERAE